MADPVLRSRGGVGRAAADLAQEDPTRRGLRALFEGPPTGRVDIPAPPEVIDRLEALEARVSAIEARLT